MCSDVHLQQKGRAPGNEGGAEGCAPGGGVVPAGIRGNDPFPRSRHCDDLVAEVGKRTPSSGAWPEPHLHRYLNPCSKIRRPSSRVACRRLTSYWASFRQVAAPKNRRVAKTSGRLPEKYVFRKTSTAASNAWNEPRQRSASPAVPKPMSPLTRSQGLCARRESRSDRRRKILPLCRSRARAPRACARCRAENRRALQARARRPDPAQDWKAPRGAKRCGKRHRLRTPVAASELHVLERVAVEHANDAAVLRVVFLVRAGRARRDSLPGRRAQG